MRRLDLCIIFVSLENIVQSNLVNAVSIPFLRFNTWIIQFQFHREIVLLLEPTSK